MRDFAIWHPRLLHRNWKTWHKDILLLSPKGHCIVATFVSFCWKRILQGRLNICRWCSFLLVFLCHICLSLCHCTLLLCALFLWLFLCSLEKVCCRWVVVSFEALQDLFLRYLRCYWWFLLTNHHCWHEFCVVLFGCGVSLPKCCGFIFATLMLWLCFLFMAISMASMFFLHYNYSYIADVFAL